MNLTTILLFIVHVFFLKHSKVFFPSSANQKKRRRKKQRHDRLKTSITLTISLLIINFHGDTYLSIQQKQRLLFIFFSFVYQRSQLDSTVQPFGCLKTCISLIPMSVPYEPFLQCNYIFQMCFFVVAPKKEFHFNCRKQCIYKFAVQYEKLLPAGYYFFNTETEHQRMSNIKRCLFEMRKKKTKKKPKMQKQSRSIANIGLFNDKERRRDSFSSMLNNFF